MSFMTTLILLLFQREWLTECLRLLTSFYIWDAPEDDTDYWQTEGERKCKICETVGFVKWLNNTYCKEKNAYIVEQHTDYCSQYGRIFIYGMER